MHSIRHMLEMKTNLIEPGDNPDITGERRKGTFPVDKMAAFIHGGDEILAKRREILKFVEDVPDFNDPIPPEFLDREKRHENAARKAVLMTDLATEIIDGSDFFGEGMYYQGLIMGRDLHALSLHYVMFMPTIQNQTDDEQMDEWLAPAITRSILGTYAQTELGHGTNLSKLETIATYDPITEEFVLHSPTISAAKWWPGNLGKSANYAIVMAQLHTKGECKGPHPFIVQLRDLETHMPMRGVRVGDIGPKFGINGGDNGFLLFDNYRIPRRNLLMRYAKVHPDGTYVEPKHSKLGYGAMVFVRSVMIKDQAVQLGAAVTIAVRYSAVRRQGEIKPDGKEVQILDYLTQQYRVFPQLARTLAFLFAANEIRDLYLKVTEQLTEGNTELLPELHALSSGLKSVVSWETAQGIEQCRLACGGHGYSQASALPEIYAYTVGGCTYEGENIVMLLQVARALIKIVEQLRSGKAQLADITEYISRKTIGKSTFSHVDKVKGDELVRDFEYAARTQLFYAYDLLHQNQKSFSFEEAWNRTSVELCRASRLHVKTYLVRNFFYKISTCYDPTLRTVLEDLGKLYALDLIASSSGFFLKDNYMTDKQIEEIRSGIYTLLSRLRPNAVALVDSLDYSDRELHSVLGRRDGNVYEFLLEWAQQSPLNKSEVSTAYQKYLGPMMQEGRSKL